MSLQEKTALFRFEASTQIGAGHAIRSIVIADALLERGWNCKVITSEETFRFLEFLHQFERIEPKQFYDCPQNCALLVIDHYDLDENYEKHFSSYAKKILVIDDLVNRKHACDILVDQTFGRKPEEYAHLVPKSCLVFTGCDYALLRSKFANIRPLALEKRRKTNSIKRILVSMGGSDPNNFTLNVLHLIKESGFDGTIDVVLGFNALNLNSVQNYLNTLSNEYKIHIDADMSQLMFNADLAIGAAGSSVWERICLGLPSILIVTADNQKDIYEKLLSAKVIFSIDNFIHNFNIHNIDLSFAKLVDGFGCNKVLLEILQEQENKSVTFKAATLKDKEMIWEWQNIPGLRQYFINTSIPTREEHELWFTRRLNQYENPFFIIYEKSEPVGTISLTYNKKIKSYDLSWYIVPNKQGKGLGSKALRLATQIVSPICVKAVVKKENIASRKSLEKAFFVTKDGINYFSDISVLT